MPDAAHVQIIYVWIMGSSYYFFVTQAHDSIPNSLVDGYHKYRQPFSPRLY